jgi:hypothetical protein
MVAPVELVRELLYYRDMKMVSGRDWAFITALLAGSSIAIPILAPVALGSIVTLIAVKIAKLRRSPIAAVDLPPVKSASGATTVYGIAHKFRSTVTSLVDAAPMLIEHATIRAKRSPSVLLRRIEHAPFLLELVDDGGTMLVTGTMHVRSSLSMHHVWVKRGDPMLAKLGVPGDLAIAGALEIHRIAEEGPVLAVTGVVEDEAVAELAFHRDGGLTPVMRGVAGAPVIVEDRRLIGVMPIVRH